MTAIEWTRRLLGQGAAPGSGPGRPRRLMLREHLCPLGDDFPVEDEEGELVFVVDGRALRVNETLVLENGSGTALYRIPRHALHQKLSMEIERAGGGPAATVRRERVGIARDRWSVLVPGGPPLRFSGTVADHEYRLDRAGQRVAEVSRRWCQPGAYGVTVAPGEDQALLVAIAVAADRMAR